MRYPVILRGVTYDKEAIVNHLAAHGTAPHDGAPARVSDLIVNRALADTIERYLSNPWSDANAFTVPEEQNTEYPVSLTVTAISSLQLDGKTVDVVVTATPTPSHRAPVDIICVLDISGSMNKAAMKPSDTPSALEEETPHSTLSLAAHAITTFAHALRNEDGFAVVAFNGSVTTILPLTPGPTAARGLAEVPLVARTSASGSTNLSAGIDAAMAIARGAPATRGARLQHIVVFTDGAPTPRADGAPVSSVVATALTAWPHAVTPIVHVVSFGYDADESVSAQDVARVGRGAYVFVPDSSALAGAMVHLLASVLTTLLPYAVVSYVAADGVAVVRDTRYCPADSAEASYPAWGVRLCIGAVPLDSARHASFAVSAVDGGVTPAAGDLGYVRVDWQTPCGRRAFAKATVPLPRTPPPQAQGSGSGSVTAPIEPLVAAETARRALVAALRCAHAAAGRGDVATAQVILAAAAADLDVTFARLVAAAADDAAVAAQHGGYGAAPADELPRPGHGGGLLLLTRSTAVQQAPPQQAPPNDGTAGDAPSDATEGPRLSAAAAAARVRGYVADVRGEGAAAVATSGTFARWGRHFLPSLAAAHAREVRATALDDGLQAYGGPVFVDTLRVLDRIITVLLAYGALRISYDGVVVVSLAPEAPPAFPVAATSVATANTTTGSPSGRAAAGQPTCAAAAQSRPSSRPAGPLPQRYYASNSRGGCVGGDSVMVTPRGGTVRARDVRAGDAVGCGGGAFAVVEAVVCVSPSATRAGFAVRVVGSGLVVTPWHPIRHGGRWVHPMALVEQGAAVTTPCADPLWTFLLAWPSAGGASLRTPAGLIRGDAAAPMGDGDANVHGSGGGGGGAGVEGGLVHGRDGPAVATTCCGGVGTACDRSRPAAFVADGVHVAALAHGCRADPVLAHPFFGHEAVASAVLARVGADGVARISEDSYVRGVDGLVMALA